MAVTANKKDNGEDTGPPIAAQEVDERYAALVRSALSAGGDGASARLLAEIESGVLLVCWSDAWLALRASGVDGCYRLSALTDCLEWHAEDCDSEEQPDTAKDCRFLAKALAVGSLQLAPRARVDEAREAQAACFRANNPRIRTRIS
jgi:hypothetical protein